MEILPSLFFRKPFPGQPDLVTVGVWSYSMSHPGAQLGPYTLHERINSGGMSEIWLATQDGGVPVAVRLMLNNSTFAFTERKRFLTGCETLKACQDNQYIIGYIEHGKIGGELALVMEYVEGANLKLLMNDGDPVLTENLAQVMIDFATALEVVHDRGYMHLDVKPENVLLTRNGSLRLIDFDLAQPIPNPARKLDKNPGTPGYMAPEQLQRQPVDQHADIWAWGVSAYELLTMRKPFPGETPDEVLHRQVHRSEFLKPRDINGDVPVALEQIILRCLSVEIAQRHHMMSVVVHELRQALYLPS